MKLTSAPCSSMRILSSVVFLLISVTLYAQEDQDKAAREAEQYIQEASEAVSDEDFQTAEALYRQAIAKDPSNATARYNMGNLYYDEDIPKDAVERHSQAAEMASEKPMKHKSFHNQGNAFMKQKKYPEAIEAYKNALRNNPKDDETRYNLALAKKMLEEEQDGGGGGDNDDQESDDQDQDDQGENDEKDQSDEGDEQDEEEGGDQENEDQQDDQGSENDENQPEDDPQEDQEGNAPEEGDQPQQQEPVPGQLTPQQIQNLLEAMGNEEKKVQDKMNAEKAKGAKTKSDKDW